MLRFYLCTFPGACISLFAWGTYVLYMWGSVSGDDASTVDWGLCGSFATFTILTYVLLFGMLVKYDYCACAYERVDSVLHVPRAVVMSVRAMWVGILVLGCIVTVTVSATRTPSVSICYAYTVTTWLLFSVGFPVILGFSIMNIMAMALPRFHLSECPFIEVDDTAEITAPPMPVL